MTLYPSKKSQYCINIDAGPFRDDRKGIITIFFRNFLTKSKYRVKISGKNDLTTVMKFVDELNAGEVFPSVNRADTLRKRMERMDEARDVKRAIGDWMKQC